MKLQHGSAPYQWSAGDSIVPARVERHPTGEFFSDVTPHVEAEMIKLYQSIMHKMPTGGAKVIQFVGTGRRVGTTRTVLTLAEVVAKQLGIGVGSLDLSSAQSASMYFEKTGGTLNPSNDWSGGTTNASRHPWPRFLGNLDILLLDTPPFADSAASMRTIPAVDGTVVVIEAGKTSLGQVRDALSIIESCGGRCLGLVLNKRRRSFLQG